jgi:hypothetical protein
VHAIALLRLIVLLFGDLSHRVLSLTARKLGGFAQAPAPCVALSCLQLLCKLLPIQSKHWSDLPSMPTPDRHALLASASKRRKPFLAPTRNMSYARTNDALQAEIDNTTLYASGTFKNVYKGNYTDGERCGEPCVAKEFKAGSVSEESYFAEEMSIIARTQGIIDKWNQAFIINRTILLNTPSIWTYVDGSQQGQKSLVEPFIHDFEKFNSNSGWADKTGGAWSDAMQALSHFSYSTSGGQHLLCDIQGGSYRDG